MSNRKENIPVHLSGHTRAPDCRNIRLANLKHFLTIIKTPLWVLLGRHNFVQQFHAKLTPFKVHQKETGPTFQLGWIRRMAPSVLPRNIVCSIYRTSWRKTHSCHTLAFPKCYYYFTPSSFRSSSQLVSF